MQSAMIGHRSEKRYKYRLTDCSINAGGLSVTVADFVPRSIGWPTAGNGRQLGIKEPYGFSCLPLLRHIRLHRVATQIALNIMQMRAVPDTQPGVWASEFTLLPLMVDCQTDRPESHLRPNTLGDTQGMTKLG